MPPLGSSSSNFSSGPFAPDPPCEGCKCKIANPSSAGSSGGTAGVGLKNGAANVAMPGVPGNAAIPFNTKLNYSSGPTGSGNAGAKFGGAIANRATAGLVGPGGSGPATGLITCVGGPNDVTSFQQVGTSNDYKGAYYVQDWLAYDSSLQTYTRHKPDGSSILYNSAGRIVSTTDPGGNVVSSYTYSGSDLTNVTISSADGTNEYEYAYTGSLTTSVTFKLKASGASLARSVTQTRYGYDSSGNLKLVGIWENSTAGTGTPNWGSAAIETSFYTYYSGTNRIRHVITPAIYRQMVNNGITDPTAESNTVLSSYAEAEYVYNTAGQVVTLYTHGGTYQQTFVYVTNMYIGSNTSLNAWVTCTQASDADGTRYYYFNRAGQLILERLLKSGTTSDWWNVRYQRFDEVTGNLVLAAEPEAITSVDVFDPGLVTLSATEGKVTQYSYWPEGDIAELSYGKGALVSGIVQHRWLYNARTIGDITINVLESEVTSRDDSWAELTVTSYGHTWHGSTFQIDTMWIGQQAVPTAENGTNTYTEREEHFNTYGLLVKTVDERGTATTYAYDTIRGGIIQKVEDQGTGKLNLTTDYQLDDRGRTIRTLGPVHDVYFSGSSATPVRTAHWTYYQDAVAGRWDFSGYQTTATTPDDQIIGPVTITRPNQSPPTGTTYAGWRLSETIEAKCVTSVGIPISGIPAPTHTFDQEVYVRWTLDFSNKGSQLKERWSYFNIPTSGYGAQSTNYGKKLFDYDSMGRQNWTMCAGGTIDKTTYNWKGQAATEELGTSAGLSVTRLNEYDVNGNLTKVTLPVGGTGVPDRITDYTYDWRNRLVQTQTTVEKDGIGDWTLISVNEYNNFNQTISITGYHTSVATGNRTSYQTTDFDVLGRPYRNKVYAVSSTSGATSNPQVSNTYYGKTGQVARSAPSGSTLFTATTYDAVGRTLVSYQAYGSYTSGSDPSSVSSAVVMSQQEMAWDAASNLLSTTTRQRFDDASGNGPLIDPSTAPQARVSYVASYADAIGRAIATANYGTNHGTSWTRDDIIPTRSDTVLVSSTSYDAAGNPTVQTDPAGIVVTKTFDNSDRLITVVENSSGSGSAVRTTNYGYSDDGWLIKLESENPTPASGTQITKWERNVVISSGGSTINSKRLVSKKIFVDSSSGSETVTFTYSYNRQLQVIGMTDQAGTAHAYGYDKLGRLLNDTVTFPSGTALDTTVGKLSTGYNERGLAIRSTSINTSGLSPVVVNEVTREYNDFNQLATEYQEHTGAVTSGSQKVQYSYESGSSNTVRPTGITYPNGTAITTAYNGTQADAISRPDQVKEGTSVIASYAYLGLGTVVDLNYDAASNTHLTMQSTGIGDAGDKYTGLDRFGRLVETIWKTSTTDLVHTKYGRNRVGGVEWQNNVKAHSLSVATQDNYYWYDGLQQVTRHDRGALTPSTLPYTGITGTQLQEEFGYDELGNWSSFHTWTPTATLAQTRAHDQVNQITGITQPSSVVQPVYDATGNMTTMPKAGNWTTSNTLQWDAWNRLVKLTEGSNNIAYAYDALTRRTTKINSSTSETRHYYYDREWRAVEERVAGASITVDRQYTWSPIDRWTLIRRKRTTSGTSLNETRFLLKDYLDPAALVEVISTVATVVERFGYDAFGQLNLMDDSFATRTTSVCDWNFLFHAEFLDSDSGLYNYGYRYLHPELGRWISRDPIGEEGGDNAYRMVANNPINFNDILGLLASGDVIKVECDKKSGGIIAVTRYDSNQGNINGNNAAQANLEMTFVPSKNDCCCIGGKYRWYQTIEVDDELGHVPRADVGNGTPQKPNLAPSYNLNFIDRPTLFYITVNNIWLNNGKAKAGKPNPSAKASLRFKTELQCEKNGKTSTLKTVRWGMDLNLTVDTKNSQSTYTVKMI